ncbi:hypothetical protein FW800_25165 [Pseudomonas sp. 910_23]
MILKRYFAKIRARAVVWLSFDDGLLLPCAPSSNTVFISLKPCQGNWQKKDPAKEPGQKP